MDMTSERDRLDEAVAWIRRRCDLAPRVVLQLGSGLGPVADALDEAASFAMGEVPHLPPCTVVAHEGRVVLGLLHGVPVMALRGRFHLYEGHEPAVVARPTRIGARLGAGVLVVTNAAGGIREDLQPGTLMLIRDHLNLTGRNVLVGDNDEELGPRFPDMSAAYDPGLGAMAAEEARAAGVAMPEGVYAGLLGPTYETPAEVRMLATLGADAVGMSTVQEVVAAAHAGLRVLGLSCITNRAAGLAEGPLSHDEVLETTRRVEGRNRALVERLVARLAGEGV